MHLGGHSALPLQCLPRRKQTSVLVVPQTNKTQANNIVLISLSYQANQKGKKHLGPLFMFAVSRQTGFMYLLLLF